MGSEMCIRDSNKGVTLSHDYPYPGQYRIQISGNETWNPAGDITGTLTSGGFDSVRLADVSNTITRVDQWAPQFRATASGNGFTGASMVKLLDNQTTCSEIPPFKYTDLTDLTDTFKYNYELVPNSWDWVPYNLLKCDTLDNTFHSVSNKTSATEREYFPQLKTSDDLRVCVSVFTNIYNLGWKDMDTLATTNKPFTNSSKVVNFNSCFAGFQGTSIDVDMTSGPSFSNTFERCNKWTTFAPGVANPNAMSKARGVKSCWLSNSKLVSFPQMNFPECTDFSKAWENCTALTSFPSVDYSSATDLSNAWWGCSNLTTHADISAPNLVTMNSTFYSNKFTISPIKDTAKVTAMQSAYQSCSNMTSVLDTGFGEVRSIQNTWYECTGITAFPATADLDRVVNAAGAWYYATSLTSFPYFKFGSIQTMSRAFQGNNILTSFGDSANQTMFDSSNTFASDAFRYTWYGCGLSAQSIENILVSLDNTGQTNSWVSVDGLSNADYKNWTDPAKAALTSLVGKGWEADYEDNLGKSAASSYSFYVNHEDGIIAFGHYKPGTMHDSGKANQERFDDEDDAIVRVLELDPEFFPRWDRKQNYFEGDYVKIGSKIYRSLQENIPADYQLPAEGSEIEAATPENRAARWAEVYDPNELNEEESIGGPVQRSA